MVAYFCHLLVRYLCHHIKQISQLATHYVDLSDMVFIIMLVSRCGVDLMPTSAVNLSDKLDKAKLTRRHKYLTSRLNYLTSRHNYLTNRLNYLTSRHIVLSWLVR